MTQLPAVPKALGTFRTLKTLRILNVVAVGSALAGATGAVLSRIMGHGTEDRFALASACTTLVFGLVWAAILRDRRTIGSSRVRWGWLASMPLAIANAATACGILVSADAGGSAIANFVKGAFLGASVGAIIWLPALLATLAAFGLPIAWAQKRAELGLAGEERGEVVIGLVSAVMAISALAMLPAATGGSLAIGAIAAVGLIAGACASVFALRRESVRRNFVRDVEAGAVEGFRVDETADGKVLIRVTSMGSGYRVANFEEQLAALDAEGETRRALLER